MLSVEIDIGQCRPSKIARSVAPGAAIALAYSISQIGLLQPITVRKVDSYFEVIVGGHRLEAARILGWSTIPAFVRDDNDLHAELALIDENLIRNDLSPAERAMSTARRKKIYAALHPETIVGATGKNRPKVRQVGEAKKPAERFSKATATATGTSERAVQRDAARGETINHKVLAKVVGTNLDTGEQLDALAKLPPEKQDELIERAVSGAKVNAKSEVKKAARKSREHELGQHQHALPTQKFGVIYADPPWKFAVCSENGMDRAADNHYPCMDTSDILAMKVSDIAANDCVLFLWATVPMLPEALATMRAWGFDYKSHCIWAKDQHGTGYWFFNKHELLLVGTKGNIPAPAPGTQAQSVIVAPVKDHSRKPLIFRVMIEKLFPSLPKIELFARTPAPGWGQWGKEAPILPGDIEEDIDGKEITPRTAEQMRDYKLLLAHEADVAAVDLDIPLALRGARA